MPEAQLPGDLQKVKGNTRRDFEGLSNYRQLLLLTAHANSEGWTRKPARRVWRGFVAPGTGGGLRMGE